MYHKGDHIRIENGAKVEKSLASMIAYRQPELLEDWRNSGDNRLFSCWLMNNHWAEYQNEISLRNGTKITVVKFTAQAIVKVS